MKFNIGKIRAYAIEKHKDQRYGDFSYSYHLDKVFLVAKQHNLSEIIKAGTLLHDIIEDTDTTYDDLVKEFGSTDLADLVFCVTDEPGKNRKERKANTYAKLKGCPDAIALKLCDRIANVEAGITLKNRGLLKMYRKEQPEFERQLRTSDVYPKLWEDLDKLIKE